MPWHSQLTIDMNLFSATKSRQQLTALGLLTAVTIALAALNWFSADAVLASRQDFDRRNLPQLFPDLDYDNDLLLDSFVLPAADTNQSLVNLQLLGLRRDRLAYIAKQGDEVLAIAVPATAEDGFNGFVDLLISFDMYGKISAARVIKELDSNALYGVVDIIESQWMKNFSGNGMRDILRISWQTVSADNEYDQFVGASITPKIVSDRIYDALVFFQSNRIALMAAGS